MTEYVVVHMSNGATISLSRVAADLLKEQLKRQGWDRAAGAGVYPAAIKNTGATGGPWTPTADGNRDACVLINYRHVIWMEWP